MSAGFKWWDLLHNEYLTHNTHISAAAVGAGVLVAAGLAFRAKAPKMAVANCADEDFIPSSKLDVRNSLEICGELVQGIARDIIGPHYYKYYPLLLFIFLWTLINNFLGNLPGLASATDNLNTTLGMGLCVFIYYNAVGIKEHGFKYLEQYTGHLHGLLLLFLGPVMFVIEVISHSVRPVTLGIRLRTNIFADHQVHHAIVGMLDGVSHSLTESLGAFGSAIGFLISAIGPVPILILGLLVVVIQAFVFTLLTMIYIGLATAHEEH